jgi:hypothetical protein
MYFPTICVDNFFDEPDKVRELAYSLEYNTCHQSNSSWPGLRTKPLHQICDDFFQLFCQKFLRLFFDYKNNKPTNWGIEAAFQRFPVGQYGNISSGWVHKDECPLAGLIYLNPEIDYSCGTSLFKPNKFISGMNTEYASLKDEQHLRFDSKKEHLYENAKNEYNSNFTETVRFGNVYNRLICYSGDMYHGVQNFFGNENQERLTLVFFVDSIGATSFPIPRMRSIQI